MSEQDEVIIELKRLRGWLIANFFASNTEGYIWPHLLDHAIVTLEALNNNTLQPKRP